MAKFQVNILGCGSATPTALHNPSCQVIDFRDNLFMIDCAEGSQTMMRRMKLKFSRLQHIFISHMHGDHCFGLPGLLSTLALLDKTGVVTVHLPESGLKTMRSFVEAFARDSDYELRWNPIPAKGGTLLETPSLTVEAFPLYHRIPCTGFIFREKPKLRHLRGDMVKFHEIPVSKLQGIKEGNDYITPAGVVIPNAALTTPADPAVSYAYASDTMFNPLVAEAVKGVDVLYHEATYASDQAASAAERGHSIASEAGKTARMAGVKKLIIGHYSKRYTDVNILVDEAKQEFDCVIPANEGLKIDLL